MISNETADGREQSLLIDKLSHCRHPEKTTKKPTNWLGQAKRCTTQIRLEVACDVISGVAVDYVGMDVRGKFGDPRSNHS